MAQTSVKLATTEADFDAARALCRAWVEYQLKTFPDQKDKILRVFEPAAYAQTLADLPRIHARPGGGVLLAALDGRPVGCVMYHPHSPGVAEVKRLFVDTPGRGHGLGRRLLTRMFAQMQVDGYERVMFSSARFLLHARALYQSVGFTDMPHPDDFPKDMHDTVYFMERPL